MASAPAVRADDPDATQIEFFEKQVRPLLVKRCYECHSGTKTSGGLSLDTRPGWQKGGESGPAIVPGKPDASLLIDAINYQSLEMPPRNKGGKLTDAEIALLTDWVRNGAVDPRDQVAKLGGLTPDEAKAWWAFQPLPKLDRPASPQQIDEFLDRESQRLGLSPHPPADKRTLIRRATYDLTGLPPTPEEVAAFLADDSPDAFSKVVERLMASPEYGVKWGRHWLDVVRYADTAGENTDRPLPHAWKYRNWVFSAFNRDLPFDEFVKLQLAGDLLRSKAEGEAHTEGIIATGYLAIARRFGHDIDKDVHLTYEDVIDNVGKNFLGLTLGCARCHDHKYDPVTTEDYYALYGIFDSTKFSFPGCEPKGQPRDLVPLLSAAETEQLMAPWRAKVAEVAAEKQRRAERILPTEKLKELASVARTVIAEGKVCEGCDVPLFDADNRSKPISGRRGDVVLLTVSPNEGHGADTTRVELVIDANDQSWSLADLVTNLHQGNPHSAPADAAWCFLETTNGPTFLHDRQDQLQGNSNLKSWSSGELPSAFVNVSAEPVQVWTTLPAKSMFVHPGAGRPVAIAWICPRDGEFTVSGRVADSHPAGLDGVSFQLEHIRSPEFGLALAEAGRVLSAPLPDPGPEPKIPVAYAVVDAEAKNSRLQQRGDPAVPGDEIPRRWLTVFGGETVPPDAGSGRRQLAEWITAQPLMARVVANRIWQGHFGRGLVRTPNDFGVRGERPIHPELLDWLAAEFVAEGHHWKPIHRLIMNSQAYQRSSARSEIAAELDPEFRSLAVFPRRRLTAEEIRDSLLAAAGNLNLAPGEAHPFPPEATWNFTQHTPFNAVYDSTQRSAYLMVQRQRRHPFLALFDGADPNSS